jgi:hypothetical protein
MGCSFRTNAFEIEAMGRGRAESRRTPVESGSTPSSARGDNAAMMHKGSCLCGSVRYEIEGELGDFGYCHCASCRKASGSAYGANAPVERANFRLVNGGETLREYESTPGKFRVFCSTCGSPMYAYLAATRDILRVRLGSLDSRFVKQPKAHTFTSEKAAWSPIHDELPRFAQWAPKSVLEQRGSRQT